MDSGGSPVLDRAASTVQAGGATVAIADDSLGIVVFMRCGVPELLAKRPRCLGGRREGKRRGAARAEAPDDVGPVIEHGQRRLRRALVVPAVAARGRLRIGD